MSVVRGIMGFMYGPEVRVQALAPIDSGHSLRSISMSMGINRSTLREWRDYPEKHVGAARCPRRASEPGSRSRTRSRWRSGRRWRGWTSSSGRSTDYAAARGEAGKSNEVLTARAVLRRFAGVFSRRSARNPLPRGSREVPMTGLAARGRPGAEGGAQSADRGLAARRGRVHVSGTPPVGATGPRRSTAPSAAPRPAPPARAG